MCNSNSIPQDDPQDKPQNRTIGDVINELATRPDIDIYILARALAKRCFPDGHNSTYVEVGGKLTCDTPGYRAERQQTLELMERVKKTLADADETLRETR